MLKRENRTIAQGVTFWNNLDYIDDTKHILSWLARVYFSNKDISYFDGCYVIRFYAIGSYFLIVTFWVISKFAMSDKGSICPINDNATIL